MNVKQPTKIEEMQERQKLRNDRSKYWAAVIGQNMSMAVCLMIPVFLVTLIWTDTTLPKLGASLAMDTLLTAALFIFAEWAAIGVGIPSGKLDDDFLAMEEIIYEQTGEYTKLFRFPGGSSNTISRNYCYGIMSSLAEYMTNMGYVYFDWNVDSGDALGGAKSSYEVANNVAAGCLENTVNVVLQHDIKGFSVDAVETILRWGRNNGYVFRALDESSYDAHHGINN